MVGDVGVEPTTSSVSTKRSTAELTALRLYYKLFLGWFQGIPRVKFLLQLTREPPII